MGIPNRGITGPGTNLECRSNGMNFEGHIPWRLREYYGNSLPAPALELNGGSNPANWQFRSASEWRLCEPTI